MNDKNGPQKLVGEVQMFRIRVAGAESKLKLLRDQARQARLRRKEAKRLAQRARRQFKRFKAELADLRQALARSEAKLFKAGGRALARKLAKVKAVANRGTRPLKKSKPAAGRRRRTLPASTPTPRRVVRKRPAIKQTKSVPGAPAVVEESDRESLTPQIPDPNS